MFHGWLCNEIKKYLSVILLQESYNIINHNQKKTYRNKFIYIYIYHQDEHISTVSACQESMACKCSGAWGSDFLAKAALHASRS